MLTDSDELIPRRNDYITPGIFLGTDTTIFDGLSKVCYGEREELEALLERSP